MFRYWIDLHRNGHVVRQEEYLPPLGMASRLDITLGSFKVGGAQVWMPVSGETTGYTALLDKKAVIMDQPQSIEKIYVVGGTMEFNKHPKPEVFTIKYKPGTPVSDALRKLNYEFGQQKVAPRPTRSEVQEMLDEGIARAARQKSELVAASPGEGFDWTPWLDLGFRATALDFIGGSVDSEEATLRLTVRSLEFCSE